MRADWEIAWTGGRRAVHLGNVADFDVQFAAEQSLAPQPADSFRYSHRYASLAPFYTPHPAVVVLPTPLDGAWLDLVSRHLEWDSVELYSGIADDDTGFADALAARPTLLDGLRATGLPLVPWGQTPEFHKMAGIADNRILTAIRRYESKAHAVALFRELASSHPGIGVREQARPESRRKLTRLIASEADAGRTVVLKSEYGVGGYGTVIVTPADVADAGSARALVRHLTEQQRLLPDQRVLVEPYIRPAVHHSDLTFDGVVAEDGSVCPVGVAVMHIEGTHYRGATVGPGLLPPETVGLVTGFGTDVGEQLAGVGYRGWFDVDFIRPGSGDIEPAEANLRLTGPAIAFMIKARLDLVRGGRHIVRVLDEMPLGARLPEEVLFEHAKRLTGLCEPLDALVLPVLPANGFEPTPSLGVAIAARSITAVDDAESLLRVANAELAAMFSAITHR